MFGKAQPRWRARGIHEYSFGAFVGAARCTRVGRCIGRLSSPETDLLAWHWPYRISRTERVCCAQNSHGEWLHSSIRNGAGGEGVCEKERFVDNGDERSYNWCWLATFLTKPGAHSPCGQTWGIGIGAKLIVACSCVPHPASCIFRSPLFKWVAHVYARSSSFSLCVSRHHHSPS